MTSYRASDAYYPHNLTILRLDRPMTPAALAGTDSESILLGELLPPEVAVSTSAPTSDRQAAISALTARMLAATTSGDMAEVARLTAEISAIASGAMAPTAASTPRTARLRNPGPEMVAAIKDSQAFKTTVSSTAYSAVLAPDAGSATAALLPQITELHTRLGLRPTLLVDDLPIISATFGFTRRSFEPT